MTGDRFQTEYLNSKVAVEYKLLCGGTDIYIIRIKNNIEIFIIFYTSCLIKYD